MTTLYAFFDMRVLPVNSDLFFFLIRAETARQDCGADWFRVIVVPGPDEGFRQGRKYPPEEHQYRVRNMLLPARQFFPACSGILSCRSAAQAHALQRSLPEGTPVYPAGYQADQPTQAAYDCGLFNGIAQAMRDGRAIPEIRVPEGAKALMRERVAALSNGRQVITLTLRETPYKTEINSKLAAWAKLVKTVRQVDGDRFCPVLVRDTYFAFGPRFGNVLDELPQLPEAALDVELRAALYEAAWLNLWTANGVSWATCVFNRKVRFIEFGIQNEKHPLHSAAYFRQDMLLEPGQQLPMFTPFQRIAWHPERADEMIRSFRRMVADIDALERAGVPARDAA